LYRAVEATRDILPGEIERWQFVEDSAREIFGRYGFREVRTPIFEFTELFTRSVGEQTDIVSKEMYTFVDRGKRSLTLRPEGTAPAVRAYVEGRVHKRETITRWYYTGPMFRYERKQKGRYRQFWQIGAEVLGSDDPAVDAEVIEMVMHYLGGLGVTDTSLLLNSLGCPVCRADYRERLVKSLTPSIGDYCEDCQRRMGENVLRVLDCKVDHEKVGGLPSILDHLCEECRAHFGTVQESLTACEVDYELRPHLVRGLDYYMRTAFEVTAGGLGAQNSILGGGRYDGLVAQLGGPDIPGFGFALGLDRLVMVLPEGVGVGKRDDLFVVTVGEPAVNRAPRLITDLRHGGLRVVSLPGGRSVKAQMRRADKSGVRFALILGEEELEKECVTLRQLSDGQERSYSLNSLADLVEDVIHARE
jgi:histidyl-tRNA synthetase